MRCARRAAARCRQARSLRPRAHQCDLVRLERPARHIADGRNGLREAVARHVLRQREVGPVRRWRTERAAHRIVRERRVDSEVQVAQGGQAGDRESERHARHIAALDRLVAQRHAAAVDRPRRSRPAEPGPPNQASRPLCAQRHRRMEAADVAKPFERHLRVEVEDPAVHRHVGVHHRHSRRRERGPQAPDFLDCRGVGVDHRGQLEGVVRHRKLRGHLGDVRYSRAPVSAANRWAFDRSGVKAIGSPTRTTVSGARRATTAPSCPATRTLTKRSLPSGSRSAPRRERRAGRQSRSAGGAPGGSRGSRLRCARWARVLAPVGRASPLR